MIVHTCGGNFISENGEKSYFKIENNADKDCIFTCLEKLRLSSSGGIEISKYINDIEVSYLVLVCEYGKFMPTLHINNNETTKVLDNLDSKKELIIFRGDYYPKTEITENFEIIKQIFIDFYDFGDSIYLNNLD